MALRKWRSQDSLVGPASPQSSIDCVPGHSDAITPILHAHGLVSESEHSVLRCVSVLDCVAGPFAILWRVISVAVSAFYRKALWTWTHIREEHAEVSPSFAYPDPPRAVTVIPGILGVVATLVHRGPSLVLWHGTGITRAAVPIQTFKAAATGRVPVAKISCAHKANFSAEALASPRDAAVLASSNSFVERHNSELTEFATSKIVCGLLELRRYCIYSHAVSSSLGKGVVRGCRAFIASVNPASIIPHKQAVAA